MLKKDLKREKEKVEEAMENNWEELHQKEAQTQIYKNLEEQLDIANYDANSLNEELTEERKVTADLRNTVETLEKEKQDLNKQLQVKTAVLEKEQKSCNVKANKGAIKAFHFDTNPAASKSSTSTSTASVSQAICNNCQITAAHHTTQPIKTASCAH